MDYRVSTPSPLEFGQKSAAGLGSGARRALSGVFNTLGRAGRATGDFAMDKALPLGVGGAAGYGTYHAAVPEDATLAQKIEGGLAAGLAGYGASGLARRSTWRNVMQKARQLDADAVSKGFASDLAKHRQDVMLKDLLMPKAKYLGASLVPVGASQAQSVLSNVGKATGNVAGVTDTWKQLADSAAQKDPSGEDVVTKMRKALEQVSGDATRASGAIAQGTEDVSRDIATGVKDVTGTVAQGTKDITGALAGAARSTEGMAEAGKTVAEGLKPLGELVSEITTKDDQGKSIIANLNRVARNTADYTDPNQGELKKQLESYGDTLKKLKQYAPYVGGGLAGAAGLYALYKYMSGRKKKPAQPEFRPGYGY